MSKTEIARGRQWLFNLLIISAALGFYLKFIANPERPILDADSPGYLEFADQLSQTPPWNRRPNDLLFSEATRTPGYPILLLLGRMLFGGTGGYVLGLHSLIGIVCAALFIFTFRKTLPILPLVVMILAAFWQMRRYFPLILTEWSAFCVILMLAASMAFRSKSCSFWMGLFASAAVLIRPALIVVVPIAALCALIRINNFKDAAKSLTLYLLGSALLWLWMGINIYRLGSFALTAFDGYQLLGVGALIGSADHKADDPEPLAGFIERVNLAKMPPRGEEETYMGRHWEFVQGSSPASHNVYKVALQDPGLKNLNPVQVNTLFRVYGVRAIQSSPSRFLRRAWQEFNMVGWRNWVFPVALIILFLLVRFSKLKQLIAPLLCLTLLHLFHSALCAAVQTLLVRYHNVTFWPVVMVVAVSIFALIYEQISRKARN